MGLDAMHAVEEGDEEESLEDLEKEYSLSLNALSLLTNSPRNTNSM